MGLLESIRNATGMLESDAGGEKYAGAYWCDDCSVRIPVTEAEMDDERVCSDCGEEMRLERLPDSGHCAC